jgi:hypothetical protein
MKERSEGGSVERREMCNEEGRNEGRKQIMKITEMDERGIF